MFGSHTLAVGLGPSPALYFCCELTDGKAHVARGLGEDPAHGYGGTETLSLTTPEEYNPAGHHTNKLGSSLLAMD